MTTVSKSRVTILVKASPQPSKSHSETVCCAGLEANGSWKRLFPIRFRRLQGDKSFARWDIVEFAYRTPRDDNRAESCRVHEDSIDIVGKTKSGTERSELVERALVGSEKQAAACGNSLAVIRPRKVSFSWKARDSSELEAMKSAFEKQAAQLSLLDDEIAAYSPCPFQFTMNYLDEDGPHTKSCADWETEATFFNQRRRYGEKAALEHLQKTYCENYVARGLVFSLGNMKKRPQTWQLLGIFPCRTPEQDTLF